MLKFLAGEKRLPEVEDPDEFKNRLKEKKRSQRLENSFHGRLLKDSEYRKNVAMVDGRKF